MSNTIRIKKLRDSAVVPKRSTVGSAGMDLCACIDESVVVQPGKIVKIPTGIAVAVPDQNFVSLVFARSGLSSKHGIAPVNCVGVIDSDYRGEVIVALINHSDQAYEIVSGERIAQLVVMPVCNFPVVECDELDDTDRGAGGFGSTGKV